MAIENNRLLGELGRVEAERELSRMKAEFISALSHELRTPLGFIKGYSTTLLRDDIVVDAVARQEFLGVIDEESSKLQRMIDDLLDASRIQANRLEMNRSRLDLKRLLENAIHKTTPGLEQSGHMLEADMPDDDMGILADPVRIEQVVHNLLDNAVRYSDPGSRIKVRAALSDMRVVVSVEDQGGGISAHELERIFEAFYRTEDARRQGIRGTGLGLAICRGIIEAHGGELWAESTLRKGSTFFFSLPLSAPLDSLAPDPGDGPEVETGGGE